VRSITAGVSLCVSAAGAPTSVQLLKPSDYEDANERILSDIRKWRFRPYLLGGQPVPVCTRVVFVYQME
jgi:TonB family protein